ncbi:hypothetical protein M885DRAFT_560264 [Pelagophyceae sp. CCMP2097]|nr:hypothetical protein M885DRAFT_560264 [Pelagophyceae sp. CCMP2097]
MDSASIILGRAATFLKTREAWATIMPVSRGARAAALLNIEVVCLTGRAATAADTATLAVVVAAVLDRAFRQLKTLKLYKCPRLTTAALERLGDCAALKSLDLTNGKGDCTALTSLDMSYCDGLTSLPEPLGLVDCAAYKMTVVTEEDNEPDEP